MVSVVLIGAAIAPFVVACTGGDDAGGATELIVYERRDDQAVNVFTIDPDTGRTQQLTSGTGFDGHPAWSPDHSRILFASDRERGAAKRELYTMDPDGTDVTRITTIDATEKWSPKFSHDGARIGFTLQSGHDHYIAVIDADGSNLRRLTPAFQFAEFPAWNPDDSEIFFAAIGTDTQGVDLLAVNVASGAVRTVISTASADVCPHFTHDGKHVTYATAPHDDPEGQADIYQHDLTSSDTTGSGDVPLTTDAGRDDYSSPSHDGKAFVFLSDRDGQTDLYLMNRAGSDVRRLTDTPDAAENVPDW